MSAAELLEHVRRLDRHYRKRFSNEDLAHQAREFARRLRGYDALTVRRAVDRVVDDEPHYPTPAKLAAACAAVADRGERSRAPRPNVDRCPQCHTEPQPRTWWRRPIGDREGVVAQGGDVPGFLRGRRDLCDCQWRASLWYRTEEELTLIGGPENPHVAHALRRRARKGRTA